MVELMHHLALLLIVGLLQEADNELESLQVTRKGDLDSFVVRHTFDDRTEVLYIFEGPLLVEHDLLISQLASLDNYLDFLEIERFLVHKLDLRIVLGLIWTI